MTQNTEKNVLKILFVSFLTISLVLRIWLGIANTEANDNHIDVVRLLQQEKQVFVEDCWQCYHPKLFHYTTLHLGTIFGDGDVTSFIKVGQLINVFAGILTMGIVLFFIFKQKLTAYTKIVTSFFILLTPKFVSVSVQPSNDMLVIFFSTLTFFLLWKYAKSTKNKLTYLILSFMFAILAAVSKMSGILTVAIVLGFFWSRIGITTLVQKQLPIVLLFFTLTATLVAIPIVYYSGPYHFHHTKYGDPFILNADKDTVPHFFEKTDTWRPGTKSIASSLLTFRLESMLDQPYILNTYDNNYKVHRTSFWSVHYGMSQAVHFDQWPETWINKSPEVLNNTRRILVLGLLGPLFIIVGIIKQFQESWKSFRKDGWQYFLQKSEWLSLVILAVFYTSMVRFQLIYREFTSMKFIYAAPAFMILSYFFAKGVDVSMRKKSKILTLSIFSWAITLTIFYIYDLGILAMDLSSQQ